MIHKCPLCSKRVKNHASIDKNRCTNCNNFFHFKCLGLNEGSKSPSWLCQVCLSRDLPFFDLDSTNLQLTLQARSVDDLSGLKILPNFTIQSLLDKIPGSFTIETDEFISDSTVSRYYKIDEFLNKKISHNAFSILHMNISSLQGHIDDLKILLSLLNHKFSVIGITETRIREGSDPLLNIDIDGYVFKGVGTKTSCGGVGLYINSDLDFSFRKKLSLSVKNVGESIFYDISIAKNKKVLVGCIYRHHSSLRSFVDDFLVKILSNTGNSTCILLGDFNADLLKIDNHDDSNYFYNVLTSQSYRPLILQPTRVTASSATLIDNIFINNMAISSSGGNITTSISDHFSQFSALNFQPTKMKNQDRWGRSYRNFDNDAFDKELFKIDWDLLFLDKNCNEKIKIFLKSVNCLLDKMAPFKKLSQKEIKLKQKPWLTSGLLKSMRTRDNIYKKFMLAKDALRKQNLLRDFKNKRNLITTLIRSSKSQYYKNFFNEHCKNAKKTWEGIRNIIKVSTKNRSLPTKLRVGNNNITDRKEMAQKFNEFYVNIGNMVEEKIPQAKSKFSDFLKNSVPNSIFLSPVDDKEVSDMFSKIDSSKSCGPNSISSNLLKIHAKAFLYPVKDMINSSFTEGKFPDILKIAQVCTVFKKGERDLRENYRPISLLSNLSKLFERAMHSRVYNFLEKSSLIFDLQFGFRNKHSTSHAILSILDEIRENLDNNTFSCGVFVDLEKAFDTVNHKILLKKLEHYGIRNIANNWFESYLSDRNQFVSLGGINSDNLPVSCGVPQGSILGPLLFIIYINDMHYAIKFSKVHHFADDTNLLFSHKNVKILRKRVNMDLGLLFDWLCANRLSLNVGKTEFVIFRPTRSKRLDRITLKINRCKIFESNKIKYLGMILDSNLNWQHHIFELNKKLFRGVGMIYKIKNLSDASVLKSIYFSLFQSHATYGLVAWGSSRKCLEKVYLSQKKAIRAISGLGFNDSTSASFKSLRILKIFDLYKLQCASLMWDFDHGSLPDAFFGFFTKISDIHSHRTRSSTSNKLAKNVSVKTAHGKNLFKITGVDVFNEINNLSFYKSSRTRETFLKHYKNYLIDQY